MYIKKQLENDYKNTLKRTVIVIKFSESPCLMRKDNEITTKITLSARMN